MFNCDEEHNVVFYQGAFTERLKEDLLERLSALFDTQGRTSGAFSGRSVAAIIDGEETHLSIRYPSFSHQGSILDDSIEVSAKAAGSHILFTVKTTDGPDGFEYVVDQGSFRLNPDYR